MIKVLVVDDELLIRKRICLGFDWESLGYGIPDEAADGASALEAIRSGRYDLAVVDIAMPGMNGIELTRQLREENIPIHVIFLTGHSDFAYAKEAVRYGVFYYILKPVDEEEFTGALKKLKLDIEKEQRQNRLVNSLTRKQADADLVLEARYFSDLMQRGMEGREAEDVLRHAENVGFKEDEPYRIVTVSGADFGRRDVNLAENCREAVMAAREIPGRRPFSILLNIYDDTLVFLFYGPYPDEEITETAAAIAERLRERFPNRLQIGISREGKGIRELRKKYQSSVSALLGARLYGREIGIWESGNHGSRVTAADVKDLQNAVSSGDEERSRKILCGVFDKIRAEKPGYQGILSDANRLMIGLAETGSMLGVEVQLLMEYSGIEAALKNANSLEDFCAWFCSLSEGMIRSSRSRESEKKTIPVIEACCRYLRENSGNAALSQNEVADQLGISAAYLSSLFKKTMGISMMNYLKTIRLEQARRMLLEQEEEDVRAIAERAGYSDEFYFSRSFKQYFGVSPSQIRRNHQG